MDEREEMTAEVMYGSKTKQAYELIKQKILMLEYAPGQPLRELELSEQLSMSRTPIRAAIERLVADWRARGIRVETGVFGAHMKVSLVNDGPVTIWIDSQNRE